MANPAPTINQINAFNATQGTTIDFNIIGGTELVRSNRIYIYDLSDNSLICTHLYVSTESIHELPPNTDSSIVYESGKSSADFVNGAQYYAQIQTFTDIAGTEGGSGLSVAKMFWCLVDPTLTITTIPSTISTTSYNVSATYNANTSVVSNIIQQYQFNLYNATGSLLQSSGVIVGNGEQQGTSTAYDISYNFTGLSVGSSYYVTVEVTTTQGMSVSVQSNTFTVSIDTPTLGEATVVNNACDGYISVTSNLSGEYGGSGSGEIVSFETDSENVFTKLQVDLDPIQDLHGYDAPWVGGAGKNKLDFTNTSLSSATVSGTAGDFTVTATGDSYNYLAFNVLSLVGKGTFYFSGSATRNQTGSNAGCFQLYYHDGSAHYISLGVYSNNSCTATDVEFSIPSGTTVARIICYANNYGSGGTGMSATFKNVRACAEQNTTWTPYENVCPISGHTEVDVERTGVNLFDKSTASINEMWTTTGAQTGVPNSIRSELISVKPNTNYYANWTGRASLWGVYFYDKDENYISRIFAGEQSPQVITTPNNCAYIGINIPENQLDVASLNYPSTDHDYEPYNGTTYHQDIEATYTPTVQENEAYLFKQTGDVGGDRETIELVGGTVAWNQLVQSLGLSQWYSTNSTKSFANDILTLSITQTPTSWYATRGYIYVTLVQGHKCIAFANVKPSISATARIYCGTTVRNTDQATTANSYTQIHSMFTVSNANDSLNISTGSDFANWAANDTLMIKDVQIFDLTQMFGTTIADYIYSLEQATGGAGVAWFRKLFPKAYYPYNAGELISVKTSSHDTVGKNRLDVGNLVQGNFFVPAPSNLNNVSYDGYIPLESGQQYTWSAVVPQSGGRYIRFYDSAKAELTSERINNYSSDAKITFTMPNNAKYICIMWFSNVQILVADCSQSQIELGSQATDFEPYTKNTYPLDSDLTLRGIPKLDASNNLYYDGDTYKHDGSVNRKYGIVDLGTLNYNDASATTGLVTATSYLPNQKYYNNNWNNQPQTINSKGYTQRPYYTGNNDDVNKVDHSIGFVGSANGAVAIRDIALAGMTGAQVKTALNGVYLIYPLATPTTETADPFEEIQKVTPIYGTEEFVDNRAVPIPVGNNTQYFTRDIYGGYIDLVSGVLVVTRKLVTLDGTQTIYGPTSNRFYCVYDDAYAIDASTQLTYKGVISDRFKSDTWAGLATNGGCSPVWTKGIAWRDDSITTANDWKTYFTNNPTQFSYELATPLTFQLTPQQIQTLVGVNNVWSEQGDVELSYHIPITNLLVKRQDVADVSGDWLTLYSQPITQASDMDFTFIDFTNQYGKTYKYALVPLLTQTQSGVEVEVEGGYTVSDEVQSVFDGVFIVDSTGSQKCKANVGYGNVDMNQTVGTITPIGAKYPVVITNSKNQYHNGSISGTIVPDDYYFNGNLSRVDMVNKRDELEQFLTNKRAKIIKDWNGKIWLVMIMDNVSCTFNNNYGMGIVNFSTNWVEVGDPTNQQDLQATGLIDVGGA